MSSAFRRETGGWRVTMIYLMRHADAVHDDDDAARTLSPRGREQVAGICGVLRDRPGFDPAEIWHSPLVRARETAEQLARGLGLKCPLVMKPGLEPEENPARIAAILEKEKRNIAVVGHEPHLGALAFLMVIGPVRKGVHHPFPKAWVLALSRQDECWRSEWMARLP